jgi:hypothetical protein
MALPPAGKLLSRRELQHACKGLTDMQRLFSFGKFSGLNDKDSAIAVGYSVSVAENTKQRIWEQQNGRLRNGKYERARQVQVPAAGLAAPPQNSDHEARTGTEVVRKKGIDQVRQRPMVRD